MIIVWIDPFLGISPVALQSTTVTKLANYLNTFSLQRVLPRKIQQTFFSLLKKKLLERIKFIKDRVSSRADNN